MGDECGLAVALELLVGDGATHVRLRLAYHDTAHAARLPHAHATLACRCVRVLHLLILLHELLLVVQVRLVVHIHRRLCMLSSNQSGLLTELWQLGMRVCNRRVTCPVRAELRQVLAVVLGSVAHVHGASRVHGALVELRGVDLGIAIQIHSLELPVVRVGHYFVLRVRRLREEFLLA